MVVLDRSTATAAAGRRSELIYLGKGRTIIDDPTKYPSKEDQGLFMNATGGWAGGEIGLQKYLQATGSIPYSKQDDLEYYDRPFEFLSLGIMAYIGDEKALTQIEAFDAEVGLEGRFAFLLWRSVYITKQVSFRNRVLILFDWLKAKVFGRDLSLF